jgi:hypothetical protein
MSNDYGPQVKLARLYERTSKSGNKYFSGRLGLAKIAVLKSRDTTEDGGAIWDVLLTEAPAQNGEPRRAPRDPSTDHQTPIGDVGPAPASTAGRMLDDEIPF